MPGASNTKPIVISSPSLMNGDFDTDITSPLTVDFEFLYITPIVLEDGENFYVEVSGPNDVAIRFWEGQDIRNLPDLGKISNEAWVQNTSGSQMTIDTVFNGIGAFGADAPIPAGTYTVRISRTSFNDGRTEISTPAPK